MATASGSRRAAAAAQPLPIVINFNCAISLSLTSRPHSTHPSLPCTLLSCRKAVAITHGTHGTHCAQHATRGTQHIIVLLGAIQLGYPFAPLHWFAALRKSATLPFPLGPAGAAAAAGPTTCHKLAWKLHATRSSPSWNFICSRKFCQNAQSCETQRTFLTGHSSPPKTSLIGENYIISWATTTTTTRDTCAKLGRKLIKISW